MTKPVMVLRNVKTTALTHSEHDQNFLNLRDATISLRGGTGGTVVASDLNGTITLVAGTNVSITGDNTAKTITINAANESQNIFQNIKVVAQSEQTISADSTTDTLTMAGNGDFATSGDTVIRGVDLLADTTNDVITFVVRNNTYRSETRGTGNFAPNFYFVTGGAAIQKITIAATFIGGGSTITLQTPTGMARGDRMRLVFLVTEFVSSPATVNITGSYRIARNYQQSYFAQDDGTPQSFALNQGDSMIMDIMYDGSDYWTEINTDYFV